jgi:hypothetical protein
MLIHAPGQKFFISGFCFICLFLQKKIHLLMAQLPTLLLLQRTLNGANEVSATNSTATGSAPPLINIQSASLPDGEIRGQLARQ